MPGTDRDADDLITLIKKLFEEIGIHVSLQDPQRVLEVCDVMFVLMFRDNVVVDLAAKRRTVNHCRISPTVSQKKKGMRVSLASADVPNCTLQQRCERLHCSESSSEAGAIWCVRWVHGSSPPLSCFSALLFRLAHLGQVGMYSLQPVVAACWFVSS